MSYFSVERDLKRRHDPIRSLSFWITKKAFVLSHFCKSQWALKTAESHESGSWDSKLSIRLGCHSLIRWKTLFIWSFDKKIKKCFKFSFLFTVYTFRRRRRNKLYKKSDWSKLHVNSVTAIVSNKSSQKFTGFTGFILSSKKSSNVST